MALDLDLGKMIGPLPLGAWLGTVGGGLALMAYQRSRSAVEPASSGATEYAEDTSVPSGVGTGGWTYTPPGDTSADDVSGEPETNESWGRKAVNGLIALGYDPAVSDSAVRKYLEGGNMGAKEYALVTVALGKYGAPPILLPAPVFAPPTLPKVGSGTAGKPTVVVRPKPVSKPHIRYYTVKPGDTLSRIGKRYGVSWQAIFNANRKGKRRADGKMGMIASANVVRPGWRIIIPNS